LKEAEIGLKILLLNLKGAGKVERGQKHLAGFQEDIFTQDTVSVKESMLDRN